MEVIREHLSSQPADIILFCDTDASLFKAIVKSYSLEVDRQIADDLGYLNLHHRSRTRIGLTINYLQFEFFSSANGRLYRIIRYDSLEDASKFLLSEPRQERGAVIVCPSSRKPSCCTTLHEDEDDFVSRSKALVRSTLGFSCVALLFSDASKLGGFATDCGQNLNQLMDFHENGIRSVRWIDGLSKALFDSKSGFRLEQQAWWRSSTSDQLQSMLNFFHSELSQLVTTNDDYYGRYGRYALEHEHLSQTLIARFHSFNVKEGGSPIAATDNFRISIEGFTVAEGHIVDAPGVAIQPGRLCQDNVLIWLKKAVAVQSRDRFVVRRMDGASVGVGVVVSCN